MEKCITHKTNIGLYEEPTIYKYDYIHHQQSLEEKILKIAQISTTINNTKCLGQSRQTVKAHDTLHYLDYNKQVPFNTFWEPKDSISISIKPLLRQQILGDSQNQEVIRSRPRVYLTPGISLDDIKNNEIRKLLVNFTYMTTSNYACKDILHNVQSKHSSHHTDKDVKKTYGENIKKSPCILSARFQNEAYMWDKLQDRSLSVGNRFALKNVKSKTDQEYSDSKAKKENDHIKLKDLLENDKLHKAYNNLPLTYGGYRPHINLGIPLEKKILPVVHPDLSVSQVLHQRNAGISTL